MTPREALAALVAAFRTADVSPSTVALYVERLGRIDGALLGSAVARAVDTCRYFPTIAELLSIALQLSGHSLPSAREARAMVRAADVSVPVYRRDGSYAYTERFWRWPDDLDAVTLKLVKRAVELSGDPIRDDDGERAFGWEQDFEAVYTRLAEQDAHAALAALPASSRRALPQ